MSAKPKQEDFDFGRLYRVTDSARQVYRLLNDAVEQVGILQAAGACGIDRGDLRRALDRDNGRRVGIEHVQAIGAMCGTDMRKAIACAVVQPWDLAIGDPQPLTDAEARARCERLILSMPLGAQLLAQTYGGKP